MITLDLPLECQLLVTFHTGLRTALKTLKTAQIEEKLIRAREQSWLVAGLLCWAEGNGNCN